MAEGGFSSETRILSHSMKQMCVNTPMAGKKTMKRHDHSFESDLSAPLSPPQTVDIKQKRERSESLMLCHTNDMVATKRRLRSRSRLGLGPEDIPSAFMSPPCSSKTRDRTQSRSQNELFCYPEETAKYLEFNVEASSVYMTPVSEPREPLQNKDMNKIDPENLSSFHHQCHSLNESESSGDEEIISCQETRLKLNFEEYAGEVLPQGKPVAVTPDRSKIIGRRMGVKRVDFVKELVDINCEEICMQILCNLEPCDLQRVASVSKLWRRICKKDRIASPRLDQFISGRKQYVMRKGKENLGHNTKFDYSVPVRPPFSVKDHNTIWTPDQKQSTMAIEAVKTNILLTYDRIKCPSCGSPSKKSANNTCECDECQEIFCSLCHHKADKNHKNGKCAIKVTQSKNPKGKEAIGSKKSKDRLKRY